MSDAFLDGPEGVEYLFISHTMEIGGIESLLIRMANSLIRRKYTVSVSAPDGPMWEWLDLGIKRIRYAGNGKFLHEFVPASGRHVNIWCSLPTLMIDAWSLQRRIKNKFGATSSCTSGIFHPDQWQHAGYFSKSFFHGRLIQCLAEPGSIYFMNDASLQSHLERWGRKILRHPVFRLHVEDAGPAIRKPDHGEHLSILSVGRIVPFKNYNYDACEIMIRLQKAGIETRWTIFGDGEDRPRLVEEAEARGVGTRLNFAGEIAYGKLAQEFLRHNLFVGMGTAALEAAMSGLPTVLALSNCPNGCYGFVDEAPSDSVAETVRGYPPVDIADTILRFSQMNADEKIELSERGRQSAIERSKGEVPPFQNMFAAGRQYPTTLTKRIRSGALYFVRQTNQLVRKAIPQ